MNYYSPFTQSKEDCAPEIILWLKTGLNSTEHQQWLPRLQQNSEKTEAPATVHHLSPGVMANTVATLVVQTELLPTQTSSSLSPFPSLLQPGDDGEEDGEKEEEGKESGTVVLTGDIVTSSTPPAVAQNPEHPFQCLDCGKRFKWSSRLAHHQRSHNNERPYRCNICPKAFKGSSALLYHQR